jgi:hypothetical protein
LKQLQQERAEAEKEALQAAAKIRKIRNLKHALNQPWQPEEHGFEFSNAELTLWMRRRRLEEEADEFHYHDRLLIRKK